MTSSVLPSFHVTVEFTTHITVSYSTTNHVLLQNLCLCACSFVYMCVQHRKRDYLLVHSDMLKFPGCKRWR